MLKQEPERKQSRIHSLNAGLIETPEEKEIREESERKSREEDNKELEINLLRSQTRAQIIQAITSAALLAFSLASGYIGYLQFLAAMTSANAAKDAAGARQKSGS